MWQTIIYSVVFFLLFYFGWDVDLNLVPNIRETWVWNSEGRFGTSSPKIGEDPLKTINGYKVGGRYYSFRTGKFLDTDPKYLIDFPLLTNGYLLYEKIGDEVNFFSDAGELFWKKPINSYPRSGYYASPVLYLSGDNNTVFLMDESGNRVGKSELNGRFLTDYQFDSKNKGVIVLFSGGEIYRLDEKGNILFEKELSKDKNESFFKSVALSSNGKFTAIHYSLLDKDFILVLDELGKRVEQFSLPKFYPHKLYFVIGNDGSILFNLPDSLSFYQDGELIWEKTKSKQGGVYQTVFVSDSIYVALFESEIQFYNTNGGLIRTKRIPPSELPVRFFPGKADSVFYLQSKSDLMQFQIF